MKTLLLEAKHEIIALRRRNEILEAQIGIVEVFAAALGLKRNSGGMTPDVVWALDKEINSIDESPVKAA